MSPDYFPVPTMTATEQFKRNNNLNKLPFELGVVKYYLYIVLYAQ